MAETGRERSGFGGSGPAVAGAVKVGRDRREGRREGRRRRMGKTVTDGGFNREGGRDGSGDPGRVGQNRVPGFSIFQAQNY